LSPLKIWQLCALKSYKVFMEPPYTIVTPYKKERLELLIEILLVLGTPLRLPTVQRSIADGVYSLENHQRHEQWVDAEVGTEQYVGKECFARAKDCVFELATQTHKHTHVPHDAHKHIYTYTYTYICKRTHTYTCSLSLSLTHSFSHTHIHTHTRTPHTRIRTCTHTRTYTHTTTHICTRPCIHAHINSHLC